MSRILIFIYGLIAYLAFFVTICYAIGFITGFAVPKDINDGVEGALVPSLIINGLLLSIFVVQHTIMARPAFKQWWTTIIPRPMERSTFVLIASAILLFIFWQWRPATGVVWNVELPALRYALMAISILGFAIVFYSSFLIDHFDLFGLRQVVLHLRRREYTQHVFMERSLYKIVRHPLMAGFLLAFWATPTMTVGHFFFAIMTTGYILFGTTIEERDLIRHHGEEYQAYRRRTPMLIPGLRFRNDPAVEAHVPS